MNRFKSMYVPLLLLVFVLFTGCHPLFCVWDMGYKETDKNNIEDIAGTYLLTKHSRLMMEYEGQYKHIPISTITLKSDQKYNIVNAPDWLLDSFGNSHKSYFSISEDYYYNCEGDKCILELSHLQTGGLICKKNGKLFILLELGDGDECRGMVYEKQ